MKSKKQKTKSLKQKPKLVKWKTKKLKSKKQKTEKQKWSVAPLGFRRKAHTQSPSIRIPGVAHYVLQIVRILFDSTDREVLDSYLLIRLYNYVDAENSYRDQLENTAKMDPRGLLKKVSAVEPCLFLGLVVIHVCFEIIGASRPGIEFYS